MAIQQNFPEEGPTLNLNFANSNILDPRITFFRPSIGTCLDDHGLVRTIAANEPRFEYRYNTTTGQLESLGLLIEEQRTNLITYSDDYSFNSFTGGITITTNSIASPDGTTTADMLTSTVNGGANTCIVDKNFNISSNTDYTYSVFLKAGTSPISTTNIYFTGGTFRQAVLTVTWGATPTTSFTTTGGTTGTFSFIPYPNGWYRATITYNSGDNTVGGVSRIYVRDQGNSNVSGHTVYAWGHQVEQGSFQTSYIPTVASTVTRSADNVSITGNNFNSFYTQTNYTIFTEHIAPPVNQTSPYPRVFNIATAISGDTNRLNHFHYPITIFGNYRIGSSLVENNTIGHMEIQTTFTQGNVAKMSTRFAENNSAVVLNGTVVGTDTSCSVGSVTRDILHIGSSFGGAFLNSPISKFIYYGYPLSDSQLQSLTR